MIELLFTKDQVIREKSFGAFSDPNKERVFRLSVLSDWLILYAEVEQLESDLCECFSKVKRLESEAKHETNNN